MTASERMSVSASYVFFFSAQLGNIFTLSLSPLEGAVWPLASIRSFGAGR